MYSSTIAIPDEIPGLPPEAVKGLRQNVVAADQTLKTEANKLPNHNIAAKWIVPESRDSTLSVPVELELELGQVHSTVPVSEQVLASPEQTRKLLRNGLWWLVTRFAEKEQEKILLLAEEIKEASLVTEQ
ncbi:MAG: hypothetical protein L0241_25195 [Planctomycetia bacterium]|nr:hypothetical protein [Planctomycetia bacterium]